MPPRKDKNKPQNAGDDDEDEVSPALLAAIRKVVKEEVKAVNDRLDKIEGSVNKLLKLQKRVDDLETAAVDTNAKMEKLLNVVLPAMESHMAKVAEALAQQTLRIDVHRRKWNMIVHGVDGAAGEDEGTTRSKCLKFAKESLRVSDAEDHHIAACHRLSRKPNAGIIVRFCDLSQRDRWFAGTRNLRGSLTKMSVSPDIPPVLRPMKDNLMKERSQLEPSVKAKSKVRYLPIWPFVELKIDGQSPVGPKETLASITEKILGFDPVLKISL